jgi:hypothetical protein
MKREILPYSPSLMHIDVLLMRVNNDGDAVCEIITSQQIIPSIEARMYILELASQRK